MRAEFIEKGFLQLEKDSPRHNDNEGRTYTDKEHVQFCGSLHAISGVAFYQFAIEPVARFIVKMRDKWRNLTWEARAYALFQSLSSLQDVVSPEKFQEVITQMLDGVCPLKIKNASGQEQRRLLDTQAREWLGRIYDRLIENDYYPINSAILARLLLSIQHVESSEKRVERMLMELRKMAA